MPEAISSSSLSLFVRTVVPNSMRAALVAVWDVALLAMSV